MNDDIKTTAFVWENFGPSHADRCDAAAHRLRGRRCVLGVEIASRSDTYDWEAETGELFSKITLFEKTASQIGVLRRAMAVARSCISASEVFFCHYEHPSTFVAALALRLAGKRVFVMGDSKFDDYRRYIHRELLKAIFYIPYHGAVASGSRSQDYIRFLGVDERRIVRNYNAISLSRVRAMANSPPAPDGTPFEQRHFTIIARLVPKKNLLLALEAYVEYTRLVRDPRPLHLCGSGPLEATLRARAHELGIQARVMFRGFLQAREISRVLGTSLALILPSTEEQFGNVIIEAQAMGLPVIISESCGARDDFVRSGVNGFIVEPTNAAGFAFFMKLLCQSEETWRSCCLAAGRFVPAADASCFAERVEELLSLA